METLKMNLKMKNYLLLVVILILLPACNSNNFETTSKSKNLMKEKQEMPTFIIEREIEDVGESTVEELKIGAQSSCDVLKELGSDQIVWHHSYITEDKIYCVYQARNKALIQEHAQKVGVPANSISRLSAISSPSLAQE